MSDGEDVQLRPFTFQTAGFDARFPNTNQVCEIPKRSIFRLAQILVEERIDLFDRH